MRTLLRARLPSCIVFTTVTFFATHALAVDPSTRAQLDGNWVADGAGKDAGAWTIETKADGVTKITHKRPNQEVTEFECATNGRECTVKDEGKTVKISRWFNGAKLVQMETRGHEIIQRKFAVVQPGDTLEMEVIPVSPQGKPETLHLRRAS